MTPPAVSKRLKSKASPTRAAPARPERSRMNVRRRRPGAAGDPRLLRMYKHIYNALRAAGAADEDAAREAAATVNKLRRRLGITADELGRAAARRRGWWPGWRPARERKSRARRPA